MGLVILNHTVQYITCFWVLPGETEHALRCPRDDKMELDARSYQAGPRMLPPE